MNEMPQCVGFIVDGNRRFARERGVPTIEGHRAGSAKIQEVIEWVRKRSIHAAIFYCFSTENWNRSPEEVSTLMALLERELPRMLESAHKQTDVAIRFIGERERFSEKIQGFMRALEERTAAHKKTTILIALSYGGRSEIARAARRALEEDVPLTEESISAHLDTAGVPDPDIIVRTGGEKRLSNFLTWQSVYSELFFIDTYWPAFTEEEFDGILREYGARERRHGR